MFCIQVYLKHTSHHHLSHSYPFTKLRGTLQGAYIVWRRDGGRETVTFSPISLDSPIQTNFAGIKTHVFCRHKDRRRNTVPTQTSREDTLHKKPAGVRISARHPAGSEAVVEGFEPPLAFTPNIISSDAPSAARTHHQL